MFYYEVFLTAIVLYVILATAPGTNPTDLLTIWTVPATAFVALVCVPFSVPVLVSAFAGYATAVTFEMIFPSLDGKIILAALAGAALLVISLA